MPYCEWENKGGQIVCSNCGRVGDGAINLDQACSGVDDNLPESVIVANPQNLKSELQIVLMEA